VCFVAPRAGFALVPCGQSRFCYKRVLCMCQLESWPTYSLPHVGITKTERNRTKTLIR